VNSFSCPHCGSSDNQPGTLFCRACQKALPIPGAAPRLVEGRVMPATAAGYQVQAQELTAVTRKAGGALLTVAIIQLIVGGVVYLSARTLPAAQTTQAIVISAIVAGVGIVFLALYGWSRVNPLAAAITGLSLYVLIQLGDAMLDPTAIARGFIVKLFVISVLCRAISAGMKHRNLRAVAPVM
jgi:hypothetical protein